MQAQKEQAESTSEFLKKIEATNRFERRLATKIEKTRLKKERKLVKK